MFLTPKKAIVFDLDGTIVDSMGLFADVASDVMASVYSLSHKQARADYLRTSGLPFFSQLELLFPGDRRNAEASSTYEIEKLKQYDQAPLFQDVAKAIELFRSAGFRVCVSSNNHEANVKHKLARESVQFDLILGYRHEFFKGESHFLAILKEFSLNRDQLLFVGDSLHDALLADKSKVDFVGRLGTFAKEDFETLQMSVQTVLVTDFIQLAKSLCV